MKRLAVVQIILGGLIIGSLVYWNGRLISGYHDYSGVAPDGMGIVVSKLLLSNPGFEVWIPLYPALGLAVLGCGIAQIFKIDSRKLAITQIVLGAVVVGSLVWFIGWLEWDYGPYIYISERYGEIELNHPLGWETRLITWKRVSFLPGLGVIGTGIVQKIKARRN